MMTEEQRRFEKWASLIYDTRLLKDEKGNYRGQVLQQLWQAWQAALTQPASPALKLPGPFDANDAKMFCAAHGVEGTYELASQMANYAVDKVVRLNAPHTAPIEPICATGGAEWVKVPREPTRQMMSQGHFAMAGTDRGKFRRIYQAMIAAAPQPE